MGSKRNKQHDENDFNIGEEEAELFYSLKNAFSNLVIDEKNKGEKKEFNFKQISQPHQFGISDHKAIAQQIEPDQMAKQVENLFSTFLPDVPKEQPVSPPNTTTTTATTTSTTTSSEPATESTPTTNITSPTSNSTTEHEATSTSPDSTLSTSTSPGTGSAAPPPSPVDTSHVNPPAATSTESTKQLQNLSDQEKFERVENEIFLISETVQYMQHVLPPTSQRTLECLGKVTDSYPYVKGWACIEDKAELRQRYCVVLDKIGGWWLDEFLLFPELSLTEKEKWLNTFLRNWTRADGQSSGIENETHTSMRVAPSRRPTPPPSPPEGPIGSSVEYIARAYQDRYEAEHARSIEGRADSSGSMDDYYLATNMQRQEQEEVENRRIMSEIEKACAETEAKSLAGDRDNEEMGDGQAKSAEESTSQEAIKDEGMGEGNPSAPSAPVKEESMTEDKTNTSATQNFENSTQNTNHSSPTVDKDTKKPFYSPNNNNNNATTNKNNNINVNITSPFGSHSTNPDLFYYDSDDGKQGFGRSKVTNEYEGDLDMPSAAYAAAAAERYKSGLSKNSKFSKRRDDDDDDDDELPPGVGAGIPKDMKEWFSKQDEDDRSRRMKRGRSEDDLYDDSDSEDDEVHNQWRSKDRLQNDRFDLLSTTWRIIKNMQIVGSMRFELYKKCGMYDECVKIARALNDREKIMDSRVLARATKGPEKNDDDLEKAMKSMLHL